MKNFGGMKVENSVKEREERKDNREEIKRHERKRLRGIKLCECRITTGSSKLCQKAAFLIVQKKKGCLLWDLIWRGR